MTRVAIYARYSDERQNERSIADQIAVCMEHAGRQGWTVVATFTDAAISGYAMGNRPGVNAALASAEAGAFDILLTEDMDRLARNLEHQAHLFNRLSAVGVTIATLSTARIGLMDVAFKGLISQQYLIDLGQKTRRGMRSNAEKGLATGSRLFGYRSAPGGEQVIVPEEADIIVQICQDYVDGRSGRDIAERLNAAGVKGPRGGWWNSSSIGGSRQRGNGVLNTEQYAGVKVWNRMEVKKDHMTGKRIPVMKPESEWMRTPVPHLRIVPEELWRAVRARREAEGHQRPQDLRHKSRPGLFSGLLKCGRCGSSYTSHRKGALICAGNRERGAAFCTNNRSVSRQEVELRALDGLRTRLLSPAAVRAYVTAYHQAMEAEAAAQRSERLPLEKRAAELGRQIERMVDAICDGTATKAMRDRLAAMENERENLERRLSSPDLQPAPAQLHPHAAEAYARQVERLQMTLAAAAEDADNRPLIESVRGLVARIDITPLNDAKGGPVKITLHGDLSRFLREPDEAETADPTKWVTGGSWGRLQAVPTLPIAC